MGSKWPFGSMFNQFWQGLGKIWMRLGSSGALTIETFESRGHFLNTVGVPCCLALCYRNPRAPSLRLAERHNTRGFRPLTRVGLTLTSGLVLLSLLEWVFVSYTGFDAPYGVERGSRVSRRGAVFFGLGAMLDHFSHFFHIFHAFFDVPHSSWLFPSIFSDFS